MDNRKRLFADVVSLDVWHDAFGATKHVDLFADITFGTARIGAEKDCPLRFRLSIRRAEIVLIISDCEPVSVVKGSVFQAELNRNTVTTSIERKATATRKGRAEGKLMARSLDGSLSASAEVEAVKDVARKAENVRECADLKVTTSVSGDGHHRWMVEPNVGSTLAGKPWIVRTDAPQLRLRDQRKDAKVGIPPVVRMEVRCLREDLAIEEIELKDGNLWSLAKQKLGFDNRIFAAETYIRNELCKVGLEVESMSEKFGMITFCSITATDIEEE